MLDLLIRNCTLADGRSDETTGKLISYLVSDFIKAHEEIEE